MEQPIERLVYAMYHNNFDLQYKNPFGAIKTNTKVYIRLDVDKKYSSCKLRI